jgi:hypothetical protein
MDIFKHAVNKLNFCSIKRAVSTVLGVLHGFTYYFETNRGKNDPTPRPTRIDLVGGVNISIFGGSFYTIYLIKCIHPLCFFNIKIFCWR